MTIAAQPAGASPRPGGDEGVIQTIALTKVFDGRGGQVRAVESLDLSVHRGEVFGLLGPNGAGKTTTVGMLTTRVIPTSGEAWVGGIDVVAHPAAAKQVIGVVPQTNTLDRSLDVSENLFFHGRYFGMSAKEANRRTGELLEQFRLADRAKAGADELSGGMAQRLMVARAIMHEPDVLFLDEPTSGLDPQSRLALWDVVNELHANGQTIVLTTHYMEEADTLCAARRDRRPRPAARARHAQPAEGDDRRRHRAAHPGQRRSRSARDLPRRAARNRECTGRRRRRVRERDPRRPDPFRRHHARGPAGLCHHRRRREGDDARDRLHQPDRKGLARMTATATAETTLATTRSSAFHAFGALLRRDLRVLGKEKAMFLGRTIMQPLLLIFVFTYVFPKIGQGIGEQCRRTSPRCSSAARSRAR